MYFYGIEITAVQVFAAAMTATTVFFGYLWTRRNETLDLIEEIIIDYQDRELSQEEIKQIFEKIKAVLK